MTRFQTWILTALLLVGCHAAYGQDLSRSRSGIEGGQPVDVAALSQKAAVIVRAIVADSEAKWVGRVIYTEYNLVVQETVKGAARSTISLALPGGAIGNVALGIPGTPELSSGDEIVFFGERLSGTEGFRPVGIFDGIVPVQTRGPGSTVAPRGRPESLDDFLDEVRGLGRNR